MGKLSKLIKSNSNLKTKISTSLKQGGDISVKNDYLLVPSGNIQINSETFSIEIISKCSFIADFRESGR